MDRYNNMKMHLTEIGCESMEWVKLAQERVQLHAFVNNVMSVGFQRTRECLDPDVYC
jgi:hypothetical protein